MREMIAFVVVVVPVLSSSGAWIRMGLSGGCDVWWNWDTGANHALMSLHAVGSSRDLVELCASCLRSHSRCNRLTTVQTRTCGMCCSDILGSRRCAVNGRSLRGDLWHILLLAVLLTG